MITPPDPVDPSPDDDDQTGVRALLSALPEPDPMPAYLVERISASLAAEQAQRSHVSSSASVAPFVSTPRRRPGRLLAAAAGAAAAVVLIGIVGNNLLTGNQQTTAGEGAVSALTSGSRDAGGAKPQSSGDKVLPERASTPSSIQIRLSGVRYTQADFVTQAKAFLGSAAFGLSQPTDAGAPGVGPIGTAGGLTDCLGAIGASGAQGVRADLAFYEGQPAVIIVATMDGIPTAYAVGRGCSRADPAILHAGTPMP